MGARGTLLRQSSGWGFLGSAPTRVDQVWHRGGLKLWTSERGSPLAPCGSMKTTAPRGIAYTVLLLCAGCTPWADFTPLNNWPGAPPKRSANEVVVLAAESPARPHLDVGLVEVGDEGSGLEAQDLLKVLRETARDRGCDAVVLNSPSYRGRWGGRVYSGTCIVYRPSEAGALTTDSGPVPGLADRRRP